VGKKRSFGILVISVLAIISHAVNLIMEYLVLFAMEGWLGKKAESFIMASDAYAEVIGKMGITSEQIWFSNILTSIWDLLVIVFFIGVIRLKDFARRTVLYLAVTSLIYSLIYSINIGTFQVSVDWFIGDLDLLSPMYLPPVANFIACIIILFYFTRSKVKARFE